MYFRKSVPIADCLLTLLLAISCKPYVKREGGQDAEVAHFRRDDSRYIDEVIPSSRFSFRSGRLPGRDLPVRNASPEEMARGEGTFYLCLASEVRFSLKSGALTNCDTVAPIQNFSDKRMKSLALIKVRETGIFYLFFDDFNADAPLPAECRDPKSLRDSANCVVDKTVGSGDFMNSLIKSDKRSTKVADEGGSSFSSPVLV